MVAVYAFNRAIVRRPARSAVLGLRSVDRGVPDVDALGEEHAAYIAALETLGVTVEVLPPLEEFPDSVFVEDPALVFSEGAILLRPGAPSRIGETAEIAPALRAAFGDVLDLPAPGFADGGDVLVMPEAVLIGLSARTDATGAADLVGRLERLGRRGRVVTPPAGVLHLKTGCSLLDDETMLATPVMAAAGLFPGFRIVETAPGEEAAANALRVNDAVLLGAGFPRTAERLTDLDFTVVTVKIDEVMKLDAGLSCMSLRWWAEA
ncbi:dimethylarginine dimethylaminohydrolase family protein [Methylobrevis albus]|uniref:Dimethylarginine dimethylaminohydrolase n=1 Tax=Methylobrevis albus TaxID=2793297 RepID=A0A931MXL7_9HYPH|nr:arginine deiminase family protein [Methylobrevis albus]MBH0239288.1 dimethylarginine dimethylaminohydrolase [Methylobrevis albus]